MSVLGVNLDLYAAGADFPFDYLFYIWIKLAVLQQCLRQGHVRQRLEHRLHCSDSEPLSCRSAGPEKSNIPAYLNAQIRKHFSVSEKPDILCPGIFEVGEVLIKDSRVRKVCVLIAINLVADLLRHLWLSDNVMQSLNVWDKPPILRGETSQVRS